MCTDRNVVELKSRIYELSFTSSDWWELLLTLRIIWRNRGAHYL